MESSSNFTPPTNLPDGPKHSLDQTKTDFPQPKDKRKPMLDKYTSYPRDIIVPPSKLTPSVISEIQLQNFLPSSTNNESPNVPFTEQVIRDFLSSGRIPLFFLQRVGAIKYMGTASEQILDNPDRLVGGQWIPEFYAGKILNPFSSIELFSPQSGNVDENYVLSLLSHEFGHNAHALLSAEEMERWEAVIRMRDTLRGSTSAVSEYVQFAKSQDSMGKTRGYGDREDFAESFSIFVTNPGWLRDKFPERYTVMKDFFLSHMSSPQESTRFQEEHEKLLAQYELAHTEPINLMRNPQNALLGEQGLSGEDTKQVMESNQKDEK